MHQDRRRTLRNKRKRNRNKRGNNLGGGESEDEANRHTGPPAAASVTKYT